MTEQKPKNEANRVMRNMRVDEDLSRNGSETGWKTNPNSLERRVIGYGRGCDVTKS